MLLQPPLPPLSRFTSEGIHDEVKKSKPRPTSATMAGVNREVKSKNSGYVCAGDKRGLAYVDEIYFVVDEDEFQKELKAEADSKTTRVNKKD